MADTGYILAIDPGNKESGYVLVAGDTLRPLIQGKEPNEEVISFIRACILALLIKEQPSLAVVIERVESFGMPVGREVFDTCEWVGQFTRQALNMESSKIDITVHYVTRKDEKLTLCHSMKANDATIKQALVDRFTPGESNYGKGTKTAPGWFYGFKADIWSAYAIAVTYHDMYLQGGNT